MKLNNMLIKMTGVCLFLWFTSCAEDRRIFGDEFEIPELTDENTIQFTLDVVGDWKQVEVLATGGRMAIEWGDGRLQKIENPGAGPVNYKYGNLKSYRVRVWAEELDFFSVSGLLLPAGDLSMGYFPKMRRLFLNSFSATVELDLSSSCPNVEEINIGNWPDLERLEMSRCKKLTRVDVYTNPRLTSLSFADLPELVELNCAGNGLVNLSLKELPSLRSLYCDNNPLSTIGLNGDIPVAALSMPNCAFNSLDFLKNIHSLLELNCRFNQLTTLDLSAHRSLRFLDCSDNQKLNRLLIPANARLQVVRCHACHLDTDALNSIFDALIQAPNPSYPNHEKDFRIAYYDNPGESYCDKSILENKNWYIDTNKHFTKKYSDFHTSQRQ